MTRITYHIVEHDGGWAYRLDDVYSETFRTHEAARRAARRAAVEQGRPGDDAGITYEDEHGRWISEVVRGEDRPIADVEG
jgi:hypothetical protein